jgi:methionyl aminopeptidase
MSGGMVIAIEPMINQGTEQITILDDGWTVITADGKLSSHWEHTIAIFKDHTEILTDPVGLSQTTRT